VPSLLLCVGTQLVLAVESWRTQHQEQLKEWIDCWAEFEALNAIACYAHEHPADAFPDFIAGTAVLEAEDLGHPLLPAETCVRNDVSLHEPASPFYVVSGSNMAGKSTFLKAVGVNTVLALAGAPVRAARVRLSSFTICASNSISDSLLDEKSKFLAEAERLREALRCTGSGKPVLFLIDEILSGTNSHDRRIACESIVRALIAGGAVGILSTHDLSLTEIAYAPGMRGLNYHMESPNPGDPLTFDYRVKAGVAQHSNALAILEMLGIH
jgi:DNA mismatch repair ATPase MutS